MTVLHLKLSFSSFWSSKVKGQIKNPPMDLWKGKVAVVTGASSGIGAVICQDLCQHGVIVVGMARRLEKLNELKAEILRTKEGAVFHFVKCDLTVESEIKAAFEYVVSNLGEVDILINNAGVVKPNGVLNGNLDDLTTVMNTNLIAVVSCTKKAFQSMSDRDVAGYIINISSVAAYSPPILAGFEPTVNVYPSSKYGLRALNTVLRHELNFLKKNKIRISNISPGLVKSEMTEKYKGFAILEAKDVSDVTIYLLGTNPRVQVEDVIIRPVGEIF